MHAQPDTQLLSLRISLLRLPWDLSRGRETVPLSGHPSAKTPGMDAVDEIVAAVMFPLASTMATQVAQW